MKPASDPTASDCPQMLDDVEACVDAVIARVGKDLRVGLPLGLGKPPELVNALYRRALAEPSLKLTLLTALSLEIPRPEPGLEAAYLQPILDRVYAGVVELDYAKAVSAGTLPPNVRVLEFFFRPGSRMGNAVAQRDYICTNYTFAARDILAQGCNVTLQAVARRDTADGVRYSLSCNPDTSLELNAMLRAAESSGERKVAVVGLVNPQLPYMGNDAEVQPQAFDFVVDHPRYASALFSTPKQPVSTADYAIGLQASALVADGGTLQIGIGALGDAIVQALLLRHCRNDAYRELLDALQVPQHAGALVQRLGAAAPFERGLYGATEMFVDGFWHLIRAGILKREVYDFWALQQLVNEGRLDPERAPTLDTLEALDAMGLRVIRTQDFALLQRHGFFNEQTRYDAGFLIAPDGTRVIANVADPAARAVMAAQCLGRDGLRRGKVLHGGFFLGPRDFYQALRDMTQERRDRIGMTGVDRINQLDRNPRLYRAQRRQARFINTGMMATLSGAVVSDGLADGRVVSGVGGQYNFVAMAHQLPDGCSILMVRAVRESERGEASSNIVFNYGHTTIPRHLRDVVITEYGVADLRAQTDSEVAKRMLQVADSRFQPELLAQAKQAGRIEPDYEIPAAFRNNTPQALARKLAGHAALLPTFPLGSDLTDEEVVLGAALKRVRERAGNASRLRKAAWAMRAVLAPRRVPAHLLAYLRRMRLEDVTGLRDRIARSLLLQALSDEVPGPGPAG